MKKFKKIPTIKDKEDMRKVATELFPTRPEITWEEETIEENEMPSYTEEEVLKAAHKIKEGNAPGPDGITPEIIKAWAKEHTEVCLEIMNNVLKRGKIPKEWKMARLILLEKPKKEGQQEPNYRPLCLLNSMAKLLEYLILERLKGETEEKGNLSKNQFGFRVGRSAIDAMKAVEAAA